MQFTYSTAQKKLVTPRIAAVAQQIPVFLGIYFDVVISYAEETQVKDLLPIIFQRMNQVCALLSQLIFLNAVQLYPYQPFRDSVRHVMITKIVAIFQKWPSFVSSMKVDVLAFTNCTVLIYNRNLSLPQ